MLSNAPGFRSLYATREVHFDEVYADILDRAYFHSCVGDPRNGVRDYSTRSGKTLVETFSSRTKSFFYVPTR